MWGTGHRRIDEFSEVGLAGMANAYANAAHESSEFFDALEEAIEAKLDGMSARTLVNTVRVHTVVLLPCSLLHLQSGGSTPEKGCPGERLRCCAARQTWVARRRRGRWW